MIFGTIPEEIVIVSSIEQPVYRAWDGLPEDMDVEKEIVIPAFVCEKNNNKALATAVHWAEASRSYYDRDLRRQVKKAEPVVQEVRQNLPQKDLRVAALEIRGNGGRAYKIVGTDNYYYDLREDVMLDTMIQTGIRQGGFLEGEYVWARVSNQMKLIRVGSRLHARLIECTDRSKQKRISSKELIPGGIYADKKGTTHAYVGRVNCIDYTYNPHGGYNYYNQNPKFDIFKREVKNAYLFVYVDNRNGSYQASFERGMASNYGNITQSYNFIEMVDQISIEPAKEIARIRDFYEKKVVDYAKRNNYNTSKTHAYFRDACYYAKEATVFAVGETPEYIVEIEDLDKLSIAKPAKT